MVWWVKWNGSLSTRTDIIEPWKLTSGVGHRPEHHKPQHRRPLEHVQVLVARSGGG